MITVREILQAALRDLEVDGLASPDAECGCGIDDLAPCGHCNLDECLAARRRSDNLYYAVGNPKVLP